VDIKTAVCIVLFITGSACVTVTSVHNAGLITTLASSGKFMLYYSACCTFTLLVGYSEDRAVCKR